MVDVTTNINQIMVLGCQLVAETPLGEDHAHGVILELNSVWAAGTCPPTLICSTDTGSTTSPSTTTVCKDEQSSESVAPQLNLPQWCGACGQGRSV